MNKLSFSAIRAKQSDRHEVVVFSATAEQVNQFAHIHRIERDEQGVLSGFQRPQVNNHIREIRDYLEKPTAVLPNAIVIAFVENAWVNDLGDGRCEFFIDIAQGKPGLVVDGQQRLTALSGVDRDFQVFVSALVCQSEEELKRQFVLINNTRPLPKSLIYELLPSVGDLPPRFSKRQAAAEITSRLNFQETSLRGEIRQHTHSHGIIPDTVMQKFIMPSLSHGILRSVVAKDGIDGCVRLVSEFFSGIKLAFPNDWWDHTPKTSRLVHSVGIISMGGVFEYLTRRGGARTAAEFSAGMECLKARTAWTSGEWKFRSETRSWNKLQNVSSDITLLSEFLTSIVKEDLRRKEVSDVATAVAAE